MESLGGWIKEARKHAKLTQETLGGEMNMTKANFSQLEAGKINPSFNQIHTISKICGYPMPYTDRPIEYIEDDAVAINQYDIFASCGNGQLNQDYPELVRSIKIPKDKLFELIGRHDAKGLQLISVAGDSMHPTIDRKSLIFIDSTVKEFIHDGIYCFVLDGHTYVKRLQRMPKNIIMVISDNPSYQPFEIDLEDNIDFQVHAIFVAILPLHMIYLT